MLCIQQQKKTAPYKLAANPEYENVWGLLVAKANPGVSFKRGTKSAIL